MLVNVNPVIENTSMQKYIDDKTGKEKTFWIKPNEGFMLHAKEFDSEQENPDTREWEKELGYTKGIVTCSVKYDFSQNEREFYAVPIGYIPSNQNTTKGEK